MQAGREAMQSSMVGSNTAAGRSRRQGEQWRNLNNHLRRFMFISGFNNHPVLRDFIRAVEEFKCETSRLAEFSRFLQPGHSHFSGNVLSLATGLGTAPACEQAFAAIVQA